MKKPYLLAVILGSLTSSLYTADESSDKKITCLSESFNYWMVGVGPLPIPGLDLSVGRRTFIIENLAIEFGFNLSIFIGVNSFRFKLNALRYWGQTPNSQYYFGLGSSIGIISVYCGCLGNWPFAAPNILFGKERLTSKMKKHFFQVEAMFPIIGLRGSEKVYFPGVTLSYGLCF